MDKKIFKVLALSIQGLYKTHRKNEFIAEDQVNAGHLGALIENKSIEPVKVFTVNADFVEGAGGKRYAKGSEVSEHRLVQSQVAELLQSGALS